MPNTIAIDCCLPLETFRQFLANELSEELETSVLAHLGTCPHCQQLCDCVAKQGELEGMRSGLMRLEREKEAAAVAALRDELYQLDGNVSQLPQKNDAESQHFVPCVGKAPRNFGGYELLQEIARGGMGIVYKARQIRLDRIVAVKMILAGEFASADGISRFVTEAQATAHLDHPHIVPVYEVGEFEGRHFYSMGYVEGESLATRVAQGPLPPRAAAELMRKIASAIAYAHAHGVIHRDLKPQNVLLDAADEPRVTDFGLAKRVQRDSELTSAGQVLGTPSYMPPEQARGDLSVIGPRSDIYSLGALLYCLLTGRPPFQTASAAETIKQLIDCEPLRPRQLNPDIPGDLQTIALKCLEKSADRRYSTAQDLANDLQRWLDGRPILARPVSRTERAWRWCQRNPAVSLTGSLAAILLIAVSSIVTAAYFRESALRTEADEKRAEAEFEWDRAESALLQAEWLLYASQIASAKREWETGNVPAAWKHLNACRRDFRAWEHDYLYTLFTYNQAERSGHRGDVLSVAFSPSGQQIASGSYDETLKLWDADGGQVIRTLRHTDKITSAAFSPDGKHLVSGSWDNTLTLWNLSTGRSRTLEGHGGPVWSVAFSPDGRRIISGSGDNTLKLWDATTGAELRNLEGHTGTVYCVAFSPDGQWIVSGSGDATLRMWKTDTGDHINTFEGHAKTVWSVMFSPDGRRIISGSGDNKAKVWDTASGDEIRTFEGHSGTVYCVAFSANGQRIVSGSSDNTLKLWDLETGEGIATLKGHANSVMSVAFSPDGERIVSGSYDRTVKQWDVATGGEIVAHVALKPFDSATVQQALTLAGHRGLIWSVAFSTDRRRIASGCEDGTIKLWNLSTGKEIREFKGHAAGVLCIAFSPDGQRIASGGSDEMVMLWDVHRDDAIHIMPGHSDSVWSVAFTPDGQQIVSASYDETLRMWDAAGGKEIGRLKGYINRVTSVAFGPTGQRTVSGSCDQALGMWNAAMLGRSPLRFDGPTSPVTSVAFSLDGQRIASGCEDGTLRLWDQAMLREISTLKGHADVVKSAVFSPDGKRIASGSWDNSLKLWDTATGQETLSLSGHTGRITSVAFSPDGRYLVSGSYDKTVKLWNASQSDGED